VPAGLPADEHGSCGPMAPTRSVTRLTLRRLLRGVVYVGVLILAACWSERTPVAGPTPPRTPLPSPSAGWRDDVPRARADAVEGSKYYARYCSQCHGDFGAGDGPGAALLKPPPTNFRDAAYMRAQTPAWYYRAITNGIPGTAMAPWDPRLDAQARWDTAFYVWSLATPPGSVARGESTYVQRCAPCHGIEGAGVPATRLDDPARVRESRATVAAGVRQVHPEVVPADESDLETVVEFVSTFLYEPDRSEKGRR